MSEEYRYKAFISYRHLPPDAQAAEKLQELLEHYRQPKPLTGRIDRIFRDQTELPTSGDLDQSLKESLASSEYLIVILSSRLKESKWCMEEIRSFKEAHGGRINRILPVIVEGEPDEVLPDELRWETVEELQEDGSVRKTLREVEPLCCDIRGETGRDRRKKLKYEFLRIAAPLLHCSFDDLYQRNQRYRHHRRAVVLWSTIAALAVILTIISSFAYRTFVSEQQYEESLVHMLIQNGADSSEDGDPVCRTKKIMEAEREMENWK